MLTVHVIQDHNHPAESHPFNRETVATLMGMGIIEFVNTTHPSGYLTVKYYRKAV